MFGLPLHPAVVHIPVGLAIVVPLVALVLLFGILRGRLPGRAWGVIVLIQLVMLGGGLVALRSGQGDEDLVEKIVSEHAIEEHEEAAEWFLWGTGIGLALSIVAMAMAGRKRGSIALGLAMLGTFMVALMGARTGHLGGKLVFVEGAAQAHVQKASAAVVPLGTKGEKGEKDEKGEDRD